ncbi:hypothetical protein PISMIDRAFT_541480 [Pisolithus microcarpus 441]|uniref:Uncharacterized protein n=1 Tax=Pisolithus microcarpus 441 TaxID=765257 RepID=A0A0C9ZP53_9AGAM|nr:hypothetical protein PISMIDRAFT_541480 [Pisolithus microcarpus 441]
MCNCMASCPIALRSSQWATSSLMWKSRTCSCSHKFLRRPLIDGSIQQTLVDEATMRSTILTLGI